MGPSEKRMGNIIKIQNLNLKSQNDNAKFEMILNLINFALLTFILRFEF